MSESDIRRILEAVARVEEQVRSIRADNVRGETVHVDHETRLRALERFKYLIVGGAGAVGGGAGALVTKLLG